MSVLYRRQVPLALTGIIVIVILIKIFIPNPVANYWSVIFQQWSSLATAVSVGLGVIALLSFHIPRILRMENEPIRFQWFYSISTIAIMLIFIIVGLFIGSGSPQYNWLFTIWYAPISGLICFVSAFYSVTAVYRAFKIRSVEGAFLIIPALLIFLYDAPLGAYLFPFLGPIGVYLFTVITAAAYRAGLLCVGLGMVFIMIRTVLGQERGYMYEEEG
jgi:hypothetical protein